MTRRHPTNKRTCSLDGCSRPHHSRGLCNTHYKQRRPANADPCTKDGCSRPHHGRGLCRMHYQQQLRANADPCTKDGCNNKQKANGLCRTHYQHQLRANADPCTKDGCSHPQEATGLCTTHYRQERLENADPCTKDDCQNPQIAKGLCTKHYLRVWTHGDPDFNMHETEGPRPHVVYLCWGADGTSLYVGLTVNVKDRHADHAREKVWWKHVARIEFVDCASRDDAEAVETKLIRELRPKFNKRKKPPNCQARCI